MKPLAFIPGDKYPSISITGDKCWLLCSYCRGKYLKQMIHIYSPDELREIAREIILKGGYGLLVSGGFTRQGYLPIKPYLPVINEIKKKYDLIISIHPGFIDRDTMILLRDIGVDIVDYELILDKTILSIRKHLNITIKQHIKHYIDMIEYGPPHIVPHIPIGFTANDKWIYRAIDMLSEIEPENTVFLISMNSDMKIIDRVINILRYARTRLNGIISLGCMRPFKLKAILDKIVIEEELVDRIVNPLKKHIREYELKIIETCCSVPINKIPG